MQIYSYLNEKFHLKHKKRLQKNSQTRKISRNLHMLYQKLKQKMSTEKLVKNGKEGKGIHSSAQVKTSK